MFPSLPELEPKGRGMRALFQYSRTSMIEKAPGVVGTKVSPAAPNKAEVIEESAAEKGGGERA